jgi:O-antigen/teichoic acid export membrane protein
MFKTSAMITVARLGGAVIAIGTQVLLARLSGAETLGVYYLALALGALLSMLACLGLPWIAPKMVSEAEEQGDQGLVLRFFDWARRDILIASSLIVVVIGAGVMVAPWINEALRLPLLLGVFSVPVTALMRMNGAIANAQRLFTLAYVPELVVRPALILGLVLLLWGLGWPVTAGGILAANVLFTGAMVAGQMVFLGAKLVPWLSGPGQRTETDTLRQQETYRERRRQALPMIAATIFIAIFADLDILVAGLFLGPKDLAVFAAALRISMFLAFFIQALHQIMLRDSADALGRTDLEAVSAIVGRTNTYNLAVSLAALGGTILFGRLILGAFGPAFVEGYGPLVILVGAQLVRAAAGPGVQLLALSGHTRASVPVFAVGAALLLIGNGLLIPALGLTGAALAVLLVTLVWTMWIGWLAREKTGVRTVLYLR